MSVWASWMPASAPLYCATLIAPRLHGWPAVQMLLWSSDVTLFTDGEELNATELVGAGSWPA